MFWLCFRPGDGQSVSHAIFVPPGPIFSLTLFCHSIEGLATRCANVSQLGAPVAVKFFDTR